MTRHDLKLEIRPDGIEFHLVKGRSIFARAGKVPLASWGADMHPGVPLLLMVAEAGTARRTDTSVVVPHGLIASLAQAETAALGLPPSCPHVLVLESRGAFSDDEFSVRTRWITQSGADVIGLRRAGRSIGLNCKIPGV